MPQAGGMPRPPPPPRPPGPPPHPPPRHAAAAAPILPPALPKPSEAVERVAKKKGKKAGGALADIWATEEEIAYEEATADGGGLAIEGDALNNAASTGAGRHRSQLGGRQQQQQHQQQLRRNKKQNPDADIYDPCCPSADGYADYRDKEQIARGGQQPVKKKTKKDRQQPLPQHAQPPPTQQLVDRWYYVDNQTGSIQGPFTSEQMMQWAGAGFFPPQTPIRNGEHGTLSPLSSIDLSAPLGQSSQPTPSAAPCDPDDSVEARIALLKQDSAAAEAEATVEQGPAPPPNAGAAETGAAVDPDGGIEARIAALRGERMARNRQQELPLEGKEEDGGVEARIAGLRGEIASSAPIADVSESQDVQEEAAPYPPPPAEDAYGAPPAYDVSDAYVEPSSYAADGGIGGATMEVDDVPYPVDDVPYPVDESYPADVPYPVDDAADVYPDTDGAYEQMAGDATAAYPAVAPYYTEEDAYPLADGEGVVPPPEEESKPKLKEYKGDKAVVGFVPSNLKVRRTNKEIGETSRKRKTTNTTKRIERVRKDTEEAKPDDSGNGKEAPRTSVAEDYDQFMQEISALK